MSTVTEQILDKLHRIERVSEPTLQVVLDFVSFLESRLGKDSSPINVLTPTHTEKMSCFDLTQDLIGIGDELPEDLSTNPEHLAGYGL